MVSALQRPSGAQHHGTAAVFGRGMVNPIREIIWFKGGTQYSGSLREARVNPDVKVIIIRSNGKSFCTGADLGNLDEVRKNVIVLREHLSHYSNLLIELTNAGKPTVAAVQGARVGWRAAASPLQPTSHLQPNRQSLAFLRLREVYGV